MHHRSLPTRKSNIITPSVSVQYISSMPQSPVNSSKPESDTNVLMNKPGYNILPEQVRSRYFLFLDK